MSASRPVVGAPVGSVRRIVSRYFRLMFGGDGFLGVALCASFRVIVYLWIRDWKLRVPLVFLLSVSLKGLLYLGGAVCIAYQPRSGSV
jgi:hypothetical protein